MIETIPDVSNHETEEIETIKPNKPKNESKSKRTPKKPKIITASLDNASIDFDQTTVERKQPVAPSPEPQTETVIEPKAKSTTNIESKKKT